MATPTCETNRNLLQQKIVFAIRISVTIQFTNYLHDFLAFLLQNNFYLAASFFLAWPLVHFVLSPQLYISSWSHHSSLDQEITIWY